MKRKEKLTAKIAAGRGKGTPTPKRNMSRRVRTYGHAAQNIQSGNG